jgi:hypothetical protein
MCKGKPPMFARDDTGGGETLVERIYHHDTSLGMGFKEVNSL